MLRASLSVDVESSFRRYKVPVEMGGRFECADTGAQYVITKGGDGQLSCVAAGDGEADQLGKRYQDSATGITVLCTKSAATRVCCNGNPMELMAAKTLPSSD